MRMGRGFDAQVYAHRLPSVDDGGLVLPSVFIAGHADGGVGGKTVIAVRCQDDAFKV